MLDVTQILHVVPPQIATFLIAMLPIIELRGAIPIAVGVYDLSVFQAFVWAVLGNMIPAFFIIFFLEKFALFLTQRYQWAQRFFNWLYKRSLRKFNNHYLKYGALAVLFFVAIPLPMTGVWTASIASFLLGLKSRIVIPYMLIGVLIAGIVVSLISVGAFRM